MSTGFLRYLTCLMLVPVLSEASGAAPRDPARPRAQAQVTPAPSAEYRLNPSDVLDLDFRFTPELNQSATVRPGGFITLHGAGEVQVAGLTVPEATRAIERAYRSLLRDPLISVSLRDFRKPYITVGGEVGRPGQYDVRGAMTLSEAIAVAGGFKDSAQQSEVWVFHRLQEGVVDARKFNVKQMQNVGDLNEDPRIDPSDVIFVPKNVVSKIQRFSPLSWFTVWLLWR